MEMDLLRLVGDQLVSVLDHSWHQSWISAGTSSGLQLAPVQDQGWTSRGHSWYQSGSQLVLVHDPTTVTQFMSTTGVSSGSGTCSES
jgi:hypothetical protein